MTTETLSNGIHRNRDRVRYRTAVDVLRSIDDEAHARLLHAEAAAPATTATRLHDLDREWDTDRTIELEAAVTGLVGLALGTFVRANLLAIPAVVGAALLMNAVTGRYPLMPLLRRLGVRTSREIARERYALKALRGDFAALGPAPATAEGKAGAA